ncbi:ribosomal protein S18 acetylase RimI-like enzyme [Alkalihalobacillus xiaoxiensis]|uniref:Ribosomal protein S18 acetylase RimI-like enzyme n=1 Tax=Shouchella xiaoxiensis TaxID=766895 RepID=A0ABS2SQ13_9BACI|nr:N-acetyltransferase [Shouchella xiaoxiensis]MBM7837256.1 ribosomal protein S18 acetylase RimI-like enzyme [Shouchella xiaoxiensis]
MLRHKPLDEKAKRRLIREQEKDKHLLFYSYLTQRKQTAVFIGQYVEDQLTAVLAYTEELPFPAFSFRCMNVKLVDLPALIEFTRSYLHFSEETTCGTILSKEDCLLFQSYGLIKNEPKAFLQMKHFDDEKLVCSNRVHSVKEVDYHLFTTFMQGNGMKFFTRKELDSYPFLAIKDKDSFACAGGFHFYDEQLVEIGNIVTQPDYRGQGFASILTSELTLLGKKKAKEVYLGVFAENDGAIRLYERLGYEKTASLWIVDFALTDVSVTLAGKPF